MAHHAALFDRNQRPSGKFLTIAPQYRFHHAHQRFSAASFPPEANHRRPRRLLHRHQSMKVRVQCHHDRTPFRSKRQNLFVARPAHPGFGNMQALISQLAEQRRRVGGHTLVEHQFQPRIVPIHAAGI